MFTAQMARDEEDSNTLELDRRIEAAVKEGRRWGTRGSIRVYREDPFCFTIREELEKRGFYVIDVPREITICGDVDFSW